MLSEKFRSRYPDLGVREPIRSFFLSGNKTIKCYIHRMAGSS